MQIKLKTLLLCLFVWCLFIAGCETTKGALTGFAGMTASTVEGVVKDVAGTAGAIQAADSWIKENLW